MRKRRINTYLSKYLRRMRRNILAGVIILVFVSLSLILGIPKLVKGGDLGENAIGEVTDAVIASSSANLPTPSPSPSAPVVFNGFCLNVPVIFYHHIQPLAEAKAQGHESLTVDSGTFDLQMAYLVSRGYTTISAEALTAALLGHTGLPGKSIVVSIDDGYDDMFTYAYPIIQKYGITANLAIPTGLMNNTGYMNWDNLRQMTGSGKVFVYNHTWSHANLVGVSSEKAQYEISTAKKQLAENLGRNSNVFFYPYGTENNAAVETLRANGYSAAFTTIPGVTQCDSFMMSLRRIRIGNSSLAAYGL